MKATALNAFALLLVALATALVVSGNLHSSTSREILNASYDSTRELYKDLNPRFVSKFEGDTGRAVRVEQSHNASGKQAQSVAAGTLKADVVSFALDADVEALQAHGLIAPDWRGRAPHESHPYTSTMVFVVRKGNPKHVRDWQDLIAPGVIVVASVARTSGNGRLGLLAAYGSVTSRGGDDRQALQFVGKLRQHIVPLDAGARGVSKTFAEQRLGDVHLTYENEALNEVGGAKGELSIVYPPVSVEARPPVVWVDRNVKGTGREACAKAYVKYLFTDAAQEIIAQHDLRPINLKILEKHRARLPQITLFPVDSVAGHWPEIEALGS